MHHTPWREHTSMGLALLAVYERALRERQTAVAECLLRAIEELARLEPANQLDQAYLLLQARVVDA
jgi:hypothetical protein